MKPVVGGGSRSAFGKVDANRLNKAEYRSDALIDTEKKFTDLEISHADSPNKSNVPISRRPDDGGTLSRRRVKLLVNNFQVKFDPSAPIFRYRINVARQSDDESPIRKSLLRLIFIELCNQHASLFPLHRTAYDGGTCLFTSKTLELPYTSSSFPVNVHGKCYTCILSGQRKLDLSNVSSLLGRGAMAVPFDELEALSVVMTSGLFMEKIYVGRGYYPTKHRREDDPRCGVAPFRGLLPSLMATKNGLALCADHSATPFRKNICVVDFLVEYIPEIQDISDIPKFRDKVHMALRGLRVSVTHRPTKQTYIVSGLTKRAAEDISFELTEDDTSGKKHILLTDYYSTKWKRDLVHYSIPCLKLGRGKKPNYVPMEFCVLVNDKCFPKEELGTEASRKLKQVSLLGPDVRRSEICRMVHDEYAICCRGHSAKVLESFKVEVGINMTEVVGRVMEPPRLKIGDNLTITGDLHNCDDWEYFSREPVFMGKAAKRWAFINCSWASGKNKLNDVEAFIQKLRECCTGKEVEMEKPLVVRAACMTELSSLSDVRRLLSSVIEESGKIDKEPLQLIFCVMADRGIGYEYLKWVSEAEIGVLTQCCLSENANKATSQFLVNLCLKINVKLGGTNVKLHRPFPHFSDDDSFMFIGADVSHPDKLKRLSYSSVAAVVGSVNPPYATRYTARVSLQSPGKEEIVDFGSMCLELVNAYEQLNGKKPEKIVVFRDGVSDSQFDMVLKKELRGMKNAIYTKTYRPLITFVIAQKRHNIRLFLDDDREWGNVPPGTVVDTAIVHPFQFDFYLCSHFGATGTSKPTHYSVIWDENGFSSDDMQQLTYHLSYLYARCSKPVSLVPPVYYAHLAAYRCQMLQEVAWKAQASSMVADCLKDSMFFV